MSTLLLSVAVISAAVTQAAAFQISMHSSCWIASMKVQATCEVGADPPPPMMAIVALKVLSVRNDAAMARKVLRSI